MLSVLPPYAGQLTLRACADRSAGKASRASVVRVIMTFTCRSSTGKPSTAGRDLGWRFNASAPAANYVQADAHQLCHREGQQNLEREHLPAFDIDDGKDGQHGIEQAHGKA